MLGRAVVTGSVALNSVLQALHDGQHLRGGQHGGHVQGAVRAMEAAALHRVLQRAARAQLLDEPHLARQPRARPPAAVKAARRVVRACARARQQAAVRARNRPCRIRL